MDRLWVHGHVVESPELALVVEGLGGGPSLGQHLHALFESSTGLIHWDVQFVELTPLEAAADAEVQPPAAQQIHRRRLLSQLDGIVEGEHSHAGAQADLLGNPRQIGQQRQCGRDDSVAGEMVLRDPHRIEAQRFGVADLVHGLFVIPDLLVGVGQLDRLEQTEFHVSTN